MRRFVAILGVLLALLTAGTAVAQTAHVVVDEFAVSRWVTDNMHALNIPSIAVGIVGPDTDYYLEAYGPAELSQPFLIGSLSKSVTAMAVMLLVHDKKLSLDDKASKWVEGVPDAVTVADLLHQTSGLDRDDGMSGWTDLDASVEDMVAGATFGPPGKFSYSNLNYNILGAIVARVSGMSHADFLRQRIFEPAQMTTATASAQRPDDHVVGHQYLFGFPMASGEPDYNPAAIPAGFVWMSAQDMSRWIRLFVAHGKLDGKQVVPAEVIDQLLAAPEGSNYAMGWSIQTTDGIEYAKHTGATGAFTSAMAVVPKREFGIFVLTNINVWMGIATTRLLNGLLASILGTPQEAVTNVEFLLRLLFGLVVGLIVFTFLFELTRWVTSRFPLKLSPRERNAIIATIVVNIAVVVGVTQYFETPISVMLATQPDIGGGFLVTVIVGTLRRILTGFNKTAHLRALASEDE